MCQTINKTKSSKSAKSPAHVNPLNLPATLGTLTREEVAALAKHIGVPVGKSKDNTVANVANAIANGKAHVKTIVYISTPPTPEALKNNPYAKGKPLFVKKFRNYKTDKVIQSVPPIVVQ
jgi:hypothetical protein